MCGFERERARKRGRGDRYLLGVFHGILDRMLFLLLRRGPGGKGLVGSMGLVCRWVECTCASFRSLMGIPIVLVMVVVVGA